MPLHTMKHINTNLIGARSFLAGFGVCALIVSRVATPAHAQTVFTQNFSSSTVVTDYQGTGTNQFSGINSGGTDFNWAIGGGALQGSRTNAKAAGGDSGSANKVGILSLANGAASFGFDFNFTSNAAYPNTTGTNDVIFQVGSGYTATSTGAAGKLRVISASSRPLTRVRPSSRTDAAISPRAATS